MAPVTVLERGPHVSFANCGLPEVVSAADGRPVRVMCTSGVRSAIAHRKAGLGSACCPAAS